MKVTLERRDLLKILGSWYRTTLDESKVIVRAEPFEVELTGMDIDEPAPEPAPVVQPPAPSRAGNVVTDVPPSRKAQPLPPVTPPDYEVPKEPYDDISDVPEHRIIDLDKPSKSRSTGAPLPRVTTEAPGEDYADEIAEPRPLK